MFPFPGLFFSVGGGGISKGKVIFDWSLFLFKVFLLVCLIYFWAAYASLCN